MINIRRAKVADAVALAPRLRDADRAELKAALGMAPEVSLPIAVRQSPYVWAAEDEEGAQGLFGLDPVKGYPDFGIVWLVTSDAIWRHRRELQRLTPEWLDTMHGICPLLGNHIDARNTVHIRWLKRMGFSFLQTHERFGVERRPFHEFARLRNQPCAA